jgi:putative membrane protein
MALIDAADRERIRAAIAEVERHTDAELVTVLAIRSDDYAYVPVLWAALVALVVPLVLAPFALSLVFVVTAQMGTFCVLAVLFHVPAVAMRLVPREVRKWRAANMARRMFLEHELHHTEGEIGFMIFVSEAERFVEIIAERGISKHVEDTRWESIVAAFVVDVTEGRVTDGFLRTIAECGKVLAEAVPKTPGNRNELDDRLVLVGYELD